nr:molybdenum cofactor guanylyltransferase MobA [Vibrio sinus]
MIPVQDTHWVILAGGRGSRMNGEDKGLVELNGKTLIEHTLEALTKQAKQITIIANRNLQRYREFAPVVSDDIKGFQGPLAGIQAGLTASKAGWVGFVPCDCPFLSHDLVETFCAHVDKTHVVYFAHDGEKKQPIFSLWNKKALAPLTHYLQRGERKVGLFYKELPSKQVNFSNSRQSFINLNSPEDLKQFTKPKC